MDHTPRIGLVTGSCVVWSKDMARGGHRAMALAKRLIVDSSVCCGCLSCVTTCSLYHEGEVNPVNARLRVDLQPFEGTHIITFCHHCDDAPCAAACPAGALRISENGGWYYIDDDVCIRCRTCESVCPWAAIQYVKERDRLMKCDLCGGSPQCVQSCFTRALWYGTEEGSPNDRDKHTSRYFHLESHASKDRETQ